MIHFRWNMHLPKLSLCNFQLLNKTWILGQEFDYFAHSLKAIFIYAGSRMMEGFHKEIME